MAEKRIITTNGSINHKSGSTVSGGAFLILVPPLIPARQDSLNMQISGFNVYRSPLQYTFAGGDAAGFQNGTVYTAAAQSINPTAQHVRIDGDLVMRVDDFATMACQGVPSGGGPEAPVAGALVEVDEAGQNKVMGE